jgi:Skp family chaperone for outer membrane proteins
MIEQVNAVNGELKEMSKNQGSPAYAAKEKQLLALNSELESFRRNAQREMITKESQIYKQIYLEVSDAVEKYAYHYKYTLVLRFMRDELTEAVDPQEILARMNKQVVYYREEDDITESVLEYLNRQYGPKNTTPAAGGARSPAPRTASGNK